MAKICKITDGDISINLLTTDWLIERGGVSMSPLTDAHLVGDDPVAGKTMVISYRLATSGATHDALKDTASTLFALLRKAAQYNRTSWQLEPVWIEEQARTETNSRKALVLRAMELDRMSMMIKPADYIHYLINVGLSLELEFPWRPDQPSSLPTALSLTASDGPAAATQVHLANFRDDVAITHFKEKDNGQVWAADFELGDPDRMWIADNADLSMGDIDFFIAGWFTFESLTADNGLLSKWSAVGANNEYMLYRAQGSNRLSWILASGAGDDSVAANTFGALATDAEYFVIAWHIAGTSEFGIQVNDTAPDTDVCAINPQDGPTDFVIGDLEALTKPHDGLAKACGVWKAECTAALRESLYNDGYPKFYNELSAAELVGLQAYWEFGSGGLAFENDSEGANNLTNAGATQVVGALTSWSDLIAGSTLFPATVARGDALLWGSTDQPLKHIVIPKLGTVGNITTSTFKLYASIATGIEELVLGTDYTCYPGPTLEHCLEQNDEDIVISINPIATHTSETYDVVDAFWIFLLEYHLAPIYATNPIMHATQTAYAQKSNYFEIAVAQLKGDHPARSLIRLRCPTGGGSTAGLGTPSRFIMGAHSSHLGANEFEPWLNAGNQDNPAGWAVTYDADTSSVARTNAPGGYEAVTTFVADTSVIAFASNFVSSVQ